MHLPPGFRMTVRSAQTLPGSDAGSVDHLVFTDGVASVSVFVEHPARPRSRPAAPPPKRLRAEVANVGASSAFSTVVDGHKVTAVGEVPPADRAVHRHPGEGGGDRHAAAARPSERCA